MNQKGRVRYFAIKRRANFLACVTILFGCKGLAQLATYPDAYTFQQVLGATGRLDDFSGYSLGDVELGSQLGDFVYSYRTNTTIPMIASDSGYQVLGGAPYGVFVGGDQFTMICESTNGPLTAFGANFSYAPAAQTIPANTFSIIIMDGGAAGLSVGNPPLPGSGGSFFLGFIVRPGLSFNSVRLRSIQMDTNTIVPACEVNEMIYHNGLMSPLYYSSIRKVGPGNLSLQGGGGLPGGRFYVYATTNASLPLNLWSLAGRNYFDSSGAFSVLQTIDTTQPRMFFLLKPN